MLGLLLDMAALWAITSFLAKQDMSEDLLRFVLFAGVLMAISLGVMLGGIPPLIAFATWFGFLFLGMKFWFGASWPGAAIGASLFLAYRVVLELVFGWLRGA